MKRGLILQLLRAGTLQRLKKTTITAEERYRHEDKSTNGTKRKPTNRPIIHRTWHMLKVASQMWQSYLYEERTDWLEIMLIYEEKLR